jgi:uncharacterized protein (DUF58 family)
VPPTDLRKRLAETESRSLRLRAKKLAQGIHSGGHRAERKGSGVEFASHRPYTPGDDLKRLDRHALLRHGRLLIREFHTDTERPVHLIVDVTPSMNYAGTRSHSTAGMSETKASRALLLASALAFVAQSAGDSIGLSLISEGNAEHFVPRGGRESLEQILFRLSEVEQGLQTKKGSPSPAPWKSALDFLGGRLPRGSLIFVFSDFLDFGEEPTRALAALGTRRRLVRAAQILTTEEIQFPFSGPLRLEDLETSHQVSADGESARVEYLQALETLTDTLHRALNAHGGTLVRSVTETPPDETLRLLSIGGELKRLNQDRRRS